MYEAKGAMHLEKALDLYEAKGPMNLDKALFDKMCCYTYAGVDRFY